MEADRLELVIESEIEKVNLDLDALARKLGAVSQRLTALTKASGSSTAAFQGIATAAKTVSKNLDAVSSASRKSAAAQKEVTAASQSLAATANYASTALERASLTAAKAPNSWQLLKSVIQNVPGLVQNAAAAFNTMSMSAYTTSNGTNSITRSFQAITAGVKNTISSFKSLPSSVKQSLTIVKTSVKNTADTVRQSFASMTSGVTKKAAAPRSLMGQLGSIAFAAMSVRTISKTVMAAINSSMDFGETINLFQTAFRKIGLDAGEEFEQAFLQKAQAFNDEITDALGLDPDALMNYQARFAQMSNSMGLVVDSAYNISAAFTMLGADIASLFNLDIEAAMKKLQSGLAGQIRPLRDIGVDISKTALMQTAWNYGITESIEKMSAAAKVQLRFLTTMQQLRVTMGDMAKTIESPANQLRVLQQQVELLKRSFGNMFLPLVTQLLPYLNAFIIALRTIIDEIAALLGFELPDWTGGEIYRGIPTLTDDLEDAEDAADGATEAIKKLKRTTLGIDELNVLSLPDDSVSSSSKDDSSGGGYAVLDQAIAEEYEAYYKKFNDEVSKMSNKAKKIAESLTPALKKVLKIALEVGAALLGWKLSTGLITACSGLSVTISAVGAAVATVAGLFATAALNSSDFRKGIETIWDLVKTAAGSVHDILCKLFNTPELNGEQITNLATVAAIAIGSILATVNPVAGGIVLATTGIVTLIRMIGDWASDCVEPIEILDSTISETTKKKVAPFLEQMRELDDTLTGLEFRGDIITDEAVKTVEEQTAAIVRTITDELDSDKNTALASLQPLKGALGAEAYQEILNSNTAYYSRMDQQVRDGEAKINGIMAQAKAENRSVTETEWAEINRIQAEMQDVGISHLSESEIEYQTIMNRLKDNSTRVSLEQASEIIKNAQTTRDETIAAAEKQYATIELEAGRMLSTGAITEEQYDAIMEAAEDTKKSAVEDAKEQYDTIYETTTTKLGDTARYIDEETGGIKTKWEVFWGGIGSWFKETFDDMPGKAYEAGEKVRTTVKGWLDTVGTFFETAKENITKTWDKLWEKITGGVKTGANNVMGGIEGLINGALGGVNYLIDKINGTKGLREFLKIEGTIPHLRLVSLPRFATGGFPEDGLFMANHGELIGKFSNGKTAVANNEQITEGFARAAYRAVKEAVQDAPATGGNWIIQLVDTNGNVKAETTISAIERKNRRDGKTIIPVGA